MTAHGPGHHSVDPLVSSYMGDMRNVDGDPSGNRFDGTFQPAYFGSKPRRHLEIDEFFQNKIIEPIPQLPRRKEFATEEFVHITKEADPSTIRNPYLDRRPKWGLAVRHWIIDKQVSLRERGVSRKLDAAATRWHTVDSIDRRASHTREGVSASKLPDGSFRINEKTTAIPQKVIEGGVQIFAHKRLSHRHMIRKAGKLVQDKTHGLRTAVHYGHAHRETAKPLRNQKTQPEFQSNRRYHSKMAEHGTHHNHEAKDEIVKYGQAKALKVHKARWKIEVGRQKRDWLAAERIARSI